jgi:hypothetical protein
MEWLLLALVAGGRGWITKRWRDHQALRRTQQEELGGVRRLADEDVTYLGEQLQRLDREVSYAASRRRSALAAATSASPDGRMRSAAVNASTFATLTFDHELRGRRRE